MKVQFKKLKKKTVLIKKNKKQQNHSPLENDDYNNVAYSNSRSEASRRGGPRLKST